MSNGEKVNVGTTERPKWVPKKALAPQNKEGREWWGMVASGSVVLEEEVLDGLLNRLRKVNDRKSKGG